MSASLKRLGRTIGYTFLFAGIVLTTILLVAMAKGYQIDLIHGQINSGGLVFLASEPNGAEIFMDGNDLNKTTPAKLSLKSGQYSFSITKPGYHSWQKTIEVDGGYVSQAQYVFLPLSDTKIHTLAALSSPSILSQSPNRTLVAFFEDAADPKVRIWQLDSSTPTVVYKLSSGFIKQHAQATNLEWATDNRHLLLRLVIGTTPRYLLLDTAAPGTAQDLNQLLTKNFTSLHFSSDSSQQAYGIAGGDFYRVNLASNTISDPQALNLKTFTTNTQDIYGLRQAKSGYELVHLDSTDAVHVITGKLSLKHHYRLSFSNYNGKRLLALADLDAGTVNFYSATSEDKLAIAKLAGLSINGLSNSPDSRYLLIYGDKSIATYDLDSARLWKFELARASTAAPRWFDNYHLLLNLGGQIMLADYDGTNRQSLLKANPSFGMVASQDYHLLVGISSGGKPTLISATLLPVE